MKSYTDADLPDSSGNVMRPVFLRAIADWLDTYDKLAASMLSIGWVVGDSDHLQKARDAVSGSIIQDDLRSWADALEAGNLEMHEDDDGYYLKG